jgi:glycosyltransferase involved in cell wall biosynthesis
MLEMISADPPRFSAPAGSASAPMDCAAAPGDAPRDPSLRIRRRILVSAFAISPYRGSEPGIGWNIASRLAAYHDVTVLCCQGIGDEDNRADIDDYLKKNGPIAGIEFHFVERPALSRWLQQPHVSLAAPLYYVGYAAWQRAAFAEALRLHQMQPFDLSYQLTITGFREPGYLWKLPIPFVWGPVAGASDIPWSYFTMLGWRDRAFYGLKNIVNAVQKRTKFRSRRAARMAKHIFVNAEDNRALITGLWGCPSQVMLDTGAPAPVAEPRDFHGKRPLRLVWSGLHAGRKALPILLHALKQVQTNIPDFRFELTILGEGQQTQNWKNLAQRLELSSSIIWKGHLPRADAMAEMQTADVFAFTSLQEGTSNVVMEALSLGLPVICHDACGMGVAVNNSCGIKIPMTSPAQSIEGFASAIQTLIDEPARINQLSQGALKRADELSWDRKVQEIAQVFDRVTSTPKSR